MSAYAFFSVWMASRPRWQRWLVHTMWVIELAGVALFLFAPHAAAAGLDGVLGFTGVKDSYGVPLASTMFVRADDALFDWNGVLPRVRAGTSISAGIGNAICAFGTSSIVVTASLLLWLIRALRSVFWNDLFGSIFSTIGFSINKVLDSTPFLTMGILLGTFAGVMLIGVGRYTAGRATIAVTWLLGIFGLSFGRGLLGDLLGPSGWIDNVRTVAGGVAAVLMGQGRSLSAGTTALDAGADRMETGFADAIRQALQQWMLGRVVDGGAAAPGADAACSQAWTTGQLSGNPTTLVQSIAAGCPQEVLAHVDAGANPFEGFLVWVGVVAMLGVGAWFAWCGLNCLFRAVFYGGFAPAFILYGLVPGFPRRFLKLTAGDFVTQVVSYGIYLVLTGVYVLVLLATWTLPAAGAGALGATVLARMLVTGIVMVLFTGMLRHLAKLHRMATQQPTPGDVTPRSLAAPVTAAAGAGAAAGLGAAAGARGGAGSGGGGQVNNRSTAARINAGLQTAQIMLSRAHPAAAAAGAVAGGLGSAGYGMAQARRAKQAEAKQDSSSGRGAAGVRGPAGPHGGGPAHPGDGRGSTSAMQHMRAQDRATAARVEAASIARDAALKRPGGGAAGAGSRPVSGDSSGFRA